MGVTQQIYCKQCEQWMDLYKCGDVTNTMYRDAPFKDFPERWNHYAAMRMLWFVCRHGEHFTKIGLTSSESDEPLIGAEVFPYGEE